MARTFTDTSYFNSSVSPEYTYAYMTVVREPKAPDCDDSVRSTLGAYFSYHADPAVGPPRIVGGETKFGNHADPEPPRIIIGGETKLPETP